MENLAESIVNASFYIYFVALSAGLGLVTATLIGIKLYRSFDKRSERKTTAKTSTKTNKQRREGLI